MKATQQIPLAIPEGRRALAQMYIDLTLAFHASIFPPGEEPGELDADLTLVAVAVMLGHAEGHPMTRAQIAVRLHMPPTSALTRLTTLIEHGLVQRIDDTYCLESGRAATMPNLDRFELILSKAFATLGPLLSKSDG